MGMIIKKLQLRNFQAIKDFDADFTGDVYLIKGENELGKSTAGNNQHRGIPRSVNNQNNNAPGQVSVA